MFREWYLGKDGDGIEKRSKEMFKGGRKVEDDINEVMK